MSLTKALYKKYPWLPRQFSSPLTWKIFLGLDKLSGYFLPKPPFRWDPKKQCLRFSLGYNQWFWILHYFIHFYTLGAFCVLWDLHFLHAEDKSHSVYVAATAAPFIYVNRTAITLCYIVGMVWLPLVLSVGRDMANGINAIARLNRTLQYIVVGFW